MLRYLSSLTAGFLLACNVLFGSGAAQELEFELRFQQPVVEEPASEEAGVKELVRYHRLTKTENWSAEQTAVIVCDMWDAHHCLNAVRRVNELAPRMDQFLKELRNRGVTVIHAPSSCMAAYEQHPGRLRAQAAAVARNYPEQIADWCHSIPSEETTLYPLDQSDGGEDDDPVEHQLWAASLEARGRNPRAPWLAQCSAISIDAQRDYISDSGVEIWNILEERQLENVILVGVHTNMCVLGRPFGLRRLTSAGKNVVLARDLTDTMYNPASWPYASHFTGTDRIIDHIEQHVCPTIYSGQLLGSDFRFSTDNRKRLVMLIGENEYETERTLPPFAERQLSQNFSVSFVYAGESNPNEFVGIEQIRDADALLVSVRRRPLPAEDLQIIRDFVASGKPVIGIRTASHAFTLRNQPAPAGLAAWPEFDAQVFGGSYTNHHGNDVPVAISYALPKREHPIVVALQGNPITTGGSLYMAAPLAAGTNVLLQGAVDGKPVEPVAWTFVRSDGGASFYTSLGHKADFEQPAFIALLSAGIHWACGLKPPSSENVSAQEQRFVR